MTHLARSNIKLLKQFFSGKGMLTAAVWYTVANFFVNAMSLFATPIFTRLLDPADYGIVSQYVMWNSIISLFVGLQVFSSFNNAKSDYGDESLNKYISSVTVITILSFGFIAGTGLLFIDFFSKIIGLGKELFILVLFQSFFTNCISILSMKFICTQKRYLFIILSIIVAITKISLSIVLVINMLPETRYLGRIYGVAIPTFIIGGITLFYILYSGKFFISLKYWRYCLTLSLPLILHALSGLLLAQSDRYMLAKLVDNHAVGIYSFAYAVGSIVATIGISFNNAWVPWYYDKTKKGLNDDILKTYKSYRAIIIMMTVGFIFIIPEITRIMGSAEYQSGIYITPIIVVGSFFSFLYKFPVNYEFYHRKTLWISLGTMFAAIVNIILNFLLIPVFKEIGAAVSTLISYALLFIVHDIIVRRTLIGFQIRRKDLFLSAILVSTITILFYFLIDYLLLRYMFLIGFIIVFFCYIFGRKSVRLLFNKKSIK